MFGRYNKLSVWKQVAGESGYQILKDKNLCILNRMDTRVVDIQDEEKKELIDTLTKDTFFLKNHNLIDYSLFLI